MSEYDFTPGLDLERRIEAAAGEELRVRWEFGHWMLTYVPEEKTKLPDGFLAGLVEATGNSRAELKNRRQFAENFDAEALANALANRLSWHEIVNGTLGSRGNGNGAVLVDRPPDAEAEDARDLFEQLEAEFGFELDVCALPDSARCERFLSPEDGLRQPWRGRCFLNPPYGELVEPWVAKARRAAENDRRTTIVSLLPARVDAEWWWEHCRAGEIRFLRGRLRLGRREAPFPSAVVIFGRRPRVVWWER